MAYRYRLVTAVNYLISEEELEKDFESEVNHLIDQGFKPLGGLQVIHLGKHQNGVFKGEDIMRYHQAMFKD